MNDALRLYLESVVRVATCALPNTMADNELIGVVGLLPKPAVGYAEWSDKTGIGKDKKPEQPGPLKDEDAGTLNDRFIEQMKLVELDQNGQRNAE